MFIDYLGLLPPTCPTDVGDEAESQGGQAMGRSVQAHAMFERGTPCAPEE